MAAEQDVVANLNPIATEHIPPYVPLPGQSDWLMTGTAIFLIVMIVGIGVFYLKLHTLPDRMAHKGQKLQFEIVAVLCLIALFTHNHAFWIAALLLALVPIPDFRSPIVSMADSLAIIAKSYAPPPDPAESPAPVAASQATVETSDIAAEQTQNISDQDKG
ncbi:hypothetical protein OU789_16415 [Halocynthiibacter sp. C4]|uniref:hypothetical protein n=1 Tax=Halocynthiibacter sp. C4 TaxID=2992758 RepID=UPI00237C322F|nr:hypothetical protein [Halocynthiibacter sp. C4]MDE0591524.1 hypothetical protein [Halocynthiibacter sp. C4]